MHKIAHFIYHFVSSFARQVVSTLRVGQVRKVVRPHAKHCPVDGSGFWTRKFRTWRCNDLEPSGAACRRHPRRTAGLGRPPPLRRALNRDVAFAALGANVAGEPRLADAVARSLLNLARLQTTTGQIPNAWWPGRRYWDFHEAGCTDATCLFVVAASSTWPATRTPACRDGSGRICGAPPAGWRTRTPTSSP